MIIHRVIIHNIVTVYIGEVTYISDGPVLADLFPFMQSYYRYTGSLTHPPCMQPVMWSVYVNPVHISKETVRLYYLLLNVL